MNRTANYFVIVAVRAGTPTGTPEVIKPTAFAQMQRDAAAATGDKRGYAILAEITGDDYQTVSKTASDCDNRKCSYYSHYQVFYQPTDENPQPLGHEAFHHAEEKCDIAQHRHDQYVKQHGYESYQAERLEREAARWEKKICA